MAKGSEGGEKNGFKLNSADYKAGKLALFVCKINGETKYVMPVFGMGLWGPDGDISQSMLIKRLFLELISIMKVRQLDLVQK